MVAVARSVYYNVKPIAIYVQGGVLLASKFTPVSLLQKLDFKSNILVVGDSIMISFTVKFLSTWTWRTWNH